jgi:hypothetical protein
MEHSVSESRKYVLPSSSKSCLNAIVFKNFASRICLSVIVLCAGNVTELVLSCAGWLVRFMFSWVGGLASSCAADLITKKVRPEGCATRLDAARYRNTSPGSCR